MGLVYLREHRDLSGRRHGGSASGVVKGPLITDAYGLPIKTVTTVPGTSVESAPLTAQTQFVEIETEVNVRYAVRPKKLRYTPLSATAHHIPIPAGATVIEAVYPGAIIAFLETAAPTTPGSITFRPGYVPVLGL